MKRLAIAGALVVALVAPSVVAAEKFRGQSGQGKLAVLTTKPNGEARSFGIRWRTDDCTKGGRMYPRWTGFIRPFDRSRSGSFADHIAYTVHYTNGDVRFVASVWGERRSEDRWTGTFKIKAFIDRDSGVSNRCRLRSTAWSVRR